MRGTVQICPYGGQSIKPRPFLFLVDSRACSYMHVHAQYYIHHVNEEYLQFGDAEVPI